MLLNALWVDLDFKHFTVTEAELESLRAASGELPNAERVQEAKAFHLMSDVGLQYGLRPSYTVRTGGGLHSPPIGWLLKEGGQRQLLLDPVASFQAAQRAAEAGGKIETDEGTLRKRLHEGGYLLRTEPPRLTIRPRINGKQTYVLCISAEVFGFRPEDQDDPAEGVL